MTRQCCLSRRGRVEALLWLISIPMVMGHIASLLAVSNSLWDFQSGGAFVLEGTVSFRV